MKTREQIYDEVIKNQAITNGKKSLKKFFQQDEYEFLTEAGSKLIHSKTEDEIEFEAKRKNKFYILILGITYLFGLIYLIVGRFIEGWEPYSLSFGYYSFLIILALFVGIGFVNIFFSRNQDIKLTKEWIRIGTTKYKYNDIVFVHLVKRKNSGNIKLNYLRFYFKNETKAFVDINDYGVEKEVVCESLYSFMKKGVT